MAPHEHVTKGITSAKVGAPVLLDGFPVPRRVDWSYEGDGRGPKARARFEVRDGVPECVSFTVSAVPGGRAVDSADLRAFDLPALARAVFLDHAAVERWEGGYVAPVPEWHRAEVTGAVDEAQRQDRHLRDVARVYLRAPRAGTAAVQTVLGLARRTAHRRVAEARAAGLIPPLRADPTEYEKARVALEERPPRAASQREIREALHRRGHRLPEED